MMDKTRRRFRICLWMGYWVLLFTLTHIPVTGLGVPVVPHLDKVVHAVLYFFLTLLGGRAMLPPRASVIHVIAWAVVYSAFAAFDEWSQQSVGRTPSLGDWFADLLGITIASAWIIARQKQTKVP